MVVAGMVMEVGVGVDGGVLKGHSGNTQAARLVEIWMFTKYLLTPSRVLHRFISLCSNVQK